MIRPGDILILRDKNKETALEVISGESHNLVEGDLVVVEVDEDNFRIGEPYELKITVGTPIIDVIR